MKLFYAPTSPYVRKVMVVAHEVQLVSSIELVTSGTTPLAGDEDLIAVNPLGKIPALLTNDGMCLFDSRVICEYLADQAESATLFGRQGQRNWQALMQQALGDGLLDAALLARYEMLMRPEGERSPQWRAAQLRKVEAALDRIEALLPEIGGEATIGTISFGCALGYLDFRFPELDWRAGRPAAARWFADFDARASMVATKPYDRVAPVEPTKIKA
ncbi:glutathione S-transferase [Aminobacter sp. DSM 101952]|uniref:glutathione S-transferase n=1 Tax=Aminobacter sp. DSM 101952 TaxID=2735891 RepID=UPI0006F5D59C|nr:glutathione S-transferase [Aminobacter sp. DSM 101952]KQU73730.1 glutathione S-transferase [Aminobacter sp. DSM 101952]